MRSDTPQVLLYDVAFLTWSRPDPERLGTAEKAIGRLRLWAANGEEAIDGAKRIVKAKNLEWISLVSLDGVGNIELSQILNDPLNQDAVYTYGVEEKESN